MLRRLPCTSFITTSLASTRHCGLPRRWLLGCPITFGITKKLRLWPYSIGGMTRYKAIFGLLGIFLCFLLVTVVMVLSGFLSLRVWWWVMPIGIVIYLIVLLSLSLRTRN
jgi:hypothetical protein